MMAFIFAGLLVSVIALGPLLSIWALNTLFALGIGYTVWTWLAMVWVQAIMITKIGKNSK